MVGEEAVVFVWRCPDCPGVYDGESLLFLHSDGDLKYCPCGGQLVEDVAPEWEQRHQPDIPEYLRDTPLHRRLKELLTK